jgi:manganese efflux pump family protein
VEWPASSRLHATETSSARRIGWHRQTGFVLKLAALVIPLGLDTLGVALALGLAGLPPQHRLRISLLFAGFEAAMLLIGVALGAPLGRVVGSVADYAAAGLLIALGAYMLIADHDGDERLLSRTQRGLFGAVALGVGISLDELVIGFSAGLLRLPIAALVIAVAVQAFVFTQVGLRVGERGRDSLRELPEKLAGLLLIAVGIVLLIERLV